MNYNRIIELEDRLYEAQSAQRPLAVLAGILLITMFIFGGLVEGGQTPMSIIFVGLAITVIIGIPVYLALSRINNTIQDLKLEIQIAEEDAERF